MRLKARCLMAAATTCLQVVLVAALAFGQAAPGGAAQAPALEALTKALEGPQQIASGQLQTFTFELTVELSPGAQGQPAAEGQAAPAAPRTYRLKLARRGAQEFSLSASDPGAPGLGPLALVRTNEATAIVDHAHKRIFLGVGKLPDKETVEPGEFARRLVAAHGDLATFAEMMQAAADNRVLAMQMVGLMKLVEKPGEGRTVKLQSSEPVSGCVFTVTLVPEESRLASIEWASPQGSGSTAPTTGGRILYSLSREARLDEIPAEGYAKVEVERAELERSLLRGLPRGVEMLYRRDHPRPLRDRTREAAGGKLVIRDGQRICFLQGTPQEIGRQHGELLKKEVQATVDGVLYTYGLRQSLATGRWQLAEWRKAWSATEKTVPQDFKDELAALAGASGIDAEELQLAQLGQELVTTHSLHLTREGTSSGKKFQATVFNTPSGVGLRDSSALFVVRKKEALPLVGAGCAGFVGLLDGMNGEQIVLVSRGAGVAEHRPGGLAAIFSQENIKGGLSAIVTRRLLEHSATSQDLINDEQRRYHELWMVEGRTGFTVQLNNDSRLFEAEQKMQKDLGIQRFAEGDVEKLMAPPVADKGGNVLCVLFEPEDLVMLVATARGGNDAWQEPYRRYDLKALLAEAAEGAKKEETSKP